MLTFKRNGHYGRALEEAVSSHKSQWPLKWQGANPLHGGQDFNNMSPEKRVCCFHISHPPKLC